jgi:hypothetical protein
VTANSAQKPTSECLPMREPYGPLLAESGPRRTRMALRRLRRDSRSGQPVSFECPSYDTSALRFVRERTCIGKRLSLADRYTDSTDRLMKVATKHSCTGLFSSQAH